MKRLAFLDGVRAVLALWVVLGHQAILIGADLPALGNPAVAVDVFMLLSGFFIAATFERLREQHAPARAARDFLIRRLMRIWPLYAVLFCVCWWLLAPLTEAKLLILDTFAPPGTAAAEAAAQPPADLRWVLLHLSMLHGLVAAQAHASPLPDWSLSLEFQFYLLFPLLAWVLARRPLLLCLLAAGLAFVSPKLLGDYQLPGSLAHFTQPAALSYRLNVFLIGVMAWRLFAREAEREPRQLELLAIVLCLAPMGMRQVLGCFAMLYLLAHADGAAARALGGRTLAWLGRISFSIYLVHLPVLRLVTAALIETPGYAELPALARWGLALLCALPPLLAASQLAYWLIEAPGIRLAHRWTAAASPLTGEPSPAPSGGRAALTPPAPAPAAVAPRSAASGPRGS